MHSILFATSQFLEIKSHSSSYESEFIMYYRFPVFKTKFSESYFSEWHHKSTRYEYILDVLWGQPIKLI